MHKVGFCVLFLLSITGCTYSVLQTADTIPKKEIAGGAGSAIFMDEKVIGWFPIVYLRGGITDNAEIGARTFFSYGYIGYIGDIKYRLTKEPITFSLGAGAGFLMDGPYLLEGTAYLSKKIGISDLYLAHRINSFKASEEAFTYGLVAFGFKLPCTSWFDFIGEVNTFFPYHSGDSSSVKIESGPPYVSVGVNFHKSKK